MNLAATMSLSAGAFLGPLAAVRSSLGSIVGSIAALGGVSLSVSAAIAGVKDALAMGGELSDLSANTGESVSQLVVLRQALDNAGVGANAAGQLIGQMQRALTGINDSGEPTKKMFSQLGLDLELLKARKPVEQITAIAAAIRGLRNPAEQTQAAMQIFGRSGSEALAFLKDPEAIASAARMLGTLPSVLERNAAGFDKIGDQLANFKIKKDQFFVGMTEGVAASLNSTLDEFEKKDFTPIGLKAGRDFVGPIIEVLKQGKLTEAMGVALTGGIKIYLANFLDAAVGSAKIVWAYLRAPFQVISQDFSVSLRAAAQDLKVDLMEAALAINQSLSNVGLTQSVSQEFFRGLIEAKKRLGELKKEGRDLNKTSFGERLEKQTDFNLATMGDLPGLADAVRAQVAADLDAFLAPFRKTIAKITEGLGNLGGGNGKGGKGTDLPEPSKMFEQNSDRLARIGLFVGGAGGPALDYARRTARACEQLVGVIKNVMPINPSAGQISPTWI